MFHGIGNDIVEIERIERAIMKPGFKARVYTEKELELILNKGDKAETYAGRFSAKEAIAKAFGTGVRDFNLVDIEILQNQLGKPVVYLKNSLKEKYKNFKIELSISHCKTYATAVAIIFKGEK
ncbi:MAG: holo-ACP synthase [Fusobacteriaceae bacterium]